MKLMESLRASLILIAIFVHDAPKGFGQDVVIDEASEKAKESKKKSKKDEGPKVERPQISEEFVVTTKYVGKWIKFPTFHGALVHSNERLMLSPVPGQAHVVFFIASWCRPCQVMIEHFKDLEQKFNKLHTQFTYVFSHDTAKDAEDFRRHVGLGDHNTILANPELLNSFKQPELPSIYVGDRTNWLVARYVPVKVSDIERLETFLRGTNSM